MSLNLRPPSILAKQRRLPPAPGGLIAKERRVEKATGADNFGLGVRSAARGLWRGETGLADFLVQLNGSIVRWYEVAWREGSAMCGILPEDRTQAEQIKLDSFISIAQQRVMDLGRFIMENSRENGGKWGSLLPRLSIWSQRYNEVMETAKGMACADAKAKWRYGDTVEHCADCSHVVGRVYRLSVWDKYGWIPGSRGLACGGWKCDCKRDPTDEPVTPVRPPKLKGPKR